MSEKENLLRLKIEELEAELGKSECLINSLHGRYCPRCRRFLMDPDGLGEACGTCHAKIIHRVVLPKELVAAVRRAEKAEAELTKVLQMKQDDK